jgi:short-subunit dehydrogenase
MCPHDWGKKIILGNLNNEKLIDIWFSKKSMRIRKMLNNSNRNFSPCNVCDETAKIFLKNNWEVVAHYHTNFKKLYELKKDKKNKINLIKIDFNNLNKARQIVLKNKKLFSNTCSFVSLIGFLKSEKKDLFNLNLILDHIKINFLSNLLMINTFKKQMLNNNFGRILLSSSIGTKFGGGENSYSYSISKFLNEFIPNEFKKKNANKIL